MSRVILYLPGNLFHSNVPAARRREFAENFPEWLSVLQNAPISVTISFQGIDLDLLNVAAEDVECGSVELLSSTYAHTLLSLYAGHKRWQNHARWQAGNGVSNKAAMFTSEFDAPTKDILPSGNCILPVLASPNMVLYSECSTTGDIKPGAISDYEAIRYRGKTVVPMVNVSACQAAFFTWQRFCDQEHLEALMYEIKALANDGKDNVYVLFLDLEAPMVGSHHGLEIWKQLFQAIVEFGLTEAFTSFSNAAPLWHERAYKPERPASAMINRQLGVKWTKHPYQLDLIDRIKECPEPRTRAEHVWTSLFTTSDLLSALERKLYAEEKPINLAADLGTIEIGYDQTIISLALAALKAWETYTQTGKITVTQALRGLDLDEDGKWFANRIATLLESHGL